MPNAYDARYAQDGYYWGLRPLPTCLKVLELLPLDRPLRLLDTGCGEGRNAVFFARNGYDVTAFDLSAAGVAKTKQLAARANVHLTAFVADINDYRLTEPFDVIFGTGVLQYIPPERRQQMLFNYKDFTRPGGLNIFSVFVRKPFIGKAPDAESSAHDWVSGEILTHYHDWRIDFFVEDIFHCTSSGVPHQHAVNRVAARCPTDGK
jgi:tellurite methyltransferase